MITESKINKIIKRTINKVLNESAYSYEPKPGLDEFIKSCYNGIALTGRRMAKEVAAGLKETDDEDLSRIAEMLTEILDIADSKSPNGNKGWERAL